MGRYVKGVSFWNLVSFGSISKDRVWQCHYYSQSIVSNCEIISLLFAKPRFHSDLVLLDQFNLFFLMFRLPTDLYDWSWTRASWHDWIAWIRCCEIGLKAMVVNTNENKVNVWSTNSSFLLFVSGQWEWRIVIMISWGSS